MDSLSSLLPKVLHKRGLHGQAQASMVTYRAQAWLEAALPHLKEALHVGIFAHGVLQVQCRHSIAGQECVPLLSPLKDYLCRECKGVMITEVRLLRGK